MLGRSPFKSRKVLRSYYIKNKISKLQFKCEHSKCTWTGKLEDHDKHKYNCDYAWLTCTNKVKIQLPKRIEFNVFWCSTIFNQTSFKWCKGCAHSCRRKDMSKHVPLCKYQALRCTSNVTLFSYYFKGWKWHMYC